MKILIRLFFVLTTLAGAANAVEFNVPENIYAPLSKHQQSGSPQLSSPQRLSEIEYRQFQPIQEQISAEQYDKALNSLNKLVQRHSEKPYVISVAMKSAAYIYIAQETYPKAIKWMMRTLALSAMSTSELQAIRHDLSQLQSQAGQYQNAVNTMQSWLKTAKPSEISASDYQLLAISEFHLEHYHLSKKAAKKGLKQVKPPIELFHQLILSCELALKNYADAQKTLAILVKLKPSKKSYWVQWVGVLDLQEKPEQALVIVELMDQQNILNTEAERMQFVQRLIQQDNAFKAANKLNGYIKRKEVSNTEAQQLLLANAWERSGEHSKAIDILKNLQHDQALSRLVPIYINEQKWSHLAELLSQKLKAPVTVKNESLFLQLGYAYHQLGTPEKARQVFLVLTNSEQASKESKKSAKEWLAYLSD